MHANSKRFIHTLPTDKFFDLEKLANYIVGIKTFFCSAEKKKNIPLLFFFFFFCSFFLHLLLVYKIKKKTSFNTFLVKAQRLIMLLINRPFEIILSDYDFNQAGVIIMIALFCTACDSCTIVFTPWLCLLMTRVTTCVKENLINKMRHFLMELNHRATETAKK